MRTVMILTLTLLAGHVAYAVEFTFDEQPSQLVLLGDGKPWLSTWMGPYDPAKREETFKVYTHIFDFEGKAPITKGPGGKHTHHRGMFIGWNDTVVGDKHYEIWGMSNSTQQHVQWLQENAGKDKATQVEKIRWCDPEGKTLIEETRTIAATPGQSGTRVFDFQSTLASLAGAIQLRGDLHHAGMQVRMENEVSEHENTTQYILPEGAREEEGDKVVGALWVCCSPVVREKRYWLMHMTPPAYITMATGHPVYSIRRYARFGAFFEADLQEGKPLTVNFRILLSDKVLDQAACAALYQEYAADALLSIGKKDAGTWPQATSETDAAYIERFQQTYKKVEPAPALNTYATVTRYDAAFLGDNLKKALENVSNDQGRIAWGLANRMMSLNEMYRATGDVKYLSANLECIRAVMAVRDDKRGVKLWTGIIAPAWGSDKYAQRGRAVFGVHTGLITYPMLDFLRLAKQQPDFLSKLGNEYQTILTSAEEALAYHDRQWRDGPGEGEGHYIMMDQEDGSEGTPKPGNRLSALGRALWTSWKVTGNTTHRKRARAIGLYMKRRLTPAPDGGYYWPFWLPLEPVKEPAAKESISGDSHALLTVALPILLASEGEVFDEADMKRLGNTLIQGFGRLGNGILLGDITGNPKSDPHNVITPAEWLPLSKYAPEVRDRILAFYLNYVPSPSPLDLALLLQYR